jgi:hypothetical protein
MENKIDVNEIVKIEQMPKVFSQLEMIGTFIDEKIKDIDTLDCTEENKQEVKQRRTEINNILKELDERRKFIKNKILEPYEMFNDKYEQECKGKLVNASEVLKTKIDTIEEQQKKDKYNELYDFAMEYIVANDIQDYVTFDDIGLNITLSASMKSLKEQIIAFCEKVKQDIDLINMEEYRDEILYEYKKNHNFVESKKLVLDRHKEIERIVNIEELRKQNEEAIKQVEEKVEEVLVAPKEIIEPQQVIKVSFTLTGTKEQIKKVKDFIIELGIEYE